MVGLDSIWLILLLLYTMYLDISKVFGGVRLKPVHSAINCILCILLGDFGLQCITHCGSSRDRKVRSHFIVLLY